MNTIKPKHLQFALEYVKDFNATKAAIRAGYSERSAYSTSHDLLKRPEIQDYINKVSRESFRSIGLTKDRILAEIVSMAFGNEVEEKTKLKALTTLLEEAQENSGESREEQMKRNAGRVIEALNRFKETSKH